MDARGRGAELREQVTKVVTQVLADAAEPLGDVYANWTAAADALTCPVRYRAEGEHGWAFPGWSPTLAAGAVGKAALAHHLHTHHHVNAARGRKGHLPLPDPVGSVRAWMRAASKRESRPAVGGWVAELSATRGPEDKATLAATAAYASRWLGGFVRVMGWPLPAEVAIAAGDLDNPLGLRWAKHYRIQQEGGCVTIASSPDALWGRITSAGDHSLIVHRPISRSDADAWDRAAFEAAAATLTTGVAPARVVVTAGDTGEKLHCSVDEPLLDRGVEGMVEVVRQRVIAASPERHREPAGATAGLELDAADALPSPACHHCDHLDRCAAGQIWLKGPGRWVGGLPVTPV